MLDERQKRNLNDMLNNENIVAKSSNNVYSSVIKIVELEQYSAKDIEMFLSHIAGNSMTIPTLEVLLSIMRLYQIERLGKMSYLNNPQALAIVKDMEDYFVKKVTCILANYHSNNPRMTINTSKINAITRYFIKHSGYYNIIWNKLKLIFNKPLKRKQ